MALTKVTGDFIKDGVLTQAHLHSSHGITSSHIGEGDKLFFTNARARGAISVSGNALSYNSSTGVITSNFEESPTFTGGATFGGNVIIGGNQIRFSDAGRLYLGDSNDLQIYHDGSNSYVRDTGTGELYIDTNSSIRMISDGSYANGKMAQFDKDGSVDLYYDNSKKFETTSTGIKISDAGTVKKIVSYFNGDYTSGFKFSDLNGGIWYDAGADDLYLNANHANSQVILQSGGSTTLTLDASQNATFAGIVKIAEASNKGQLFFGTADSNYEIKGGGNYGYLGLNGPILRFNTGGSERMRIDSSANVIIGATTVDTAGSFSIKNNGIIRGVLASGTNDSTLINAISGVSNGFQLLNDANNNQSYIFHNGSTESFKIDSSGNSTFAGAVNVKTDKVQIDQDGTYGSGYGTVGFGGKANGSNRIFGATGTGDGLFLASATGRGVFIRVNGGSTDNVSFNANGTTTFAGTGQFAGAIRITETGTAQHILIGNQDSGGANKPGMIRSANASLEFGYGNSWSGEGGTMTTSLTIGSDSNATFAGTITATGGNSTQWNTAYGWGNHASANYWVKSGSWYGDLASYSYTREMGLAMTGGSEFVVLSKSGQGSVLIDGHYMAYESANGFFGSFNSTFGNLTGIRATAANTLKVMQLDGGNAILEVTQDVRAPIFYDTGNTAYFIDPSGGQLRFASTSWTGEFGGKIQYHGNHWYLQAGGTVHFRAATGTNTFQVAETGIGTISDYLTGTNSLRAPIFYDSADTAYYVDPNSTTSLKTVGSWRSNSSTWDGEFAGKMQYHSDWWYIQTTNGVLIRNASGTNNITLSAAGNITVSADVRSPIFYDSNDTTYYVNPGVTSSNSTSHSAKFRQSVQIGDSSVYNQNDGGWGARLIVSDDVHARIDVAQDANSMRSSWYSHTGHSGSYFGTVTGHHQYLVSHNQTRQTLFSGYSQESGSYRAPIFYDSNDTAYYLNPATGSILKGVQINTNSSVVGSQLKIYSTTNHQYAQIHSNGALEAMWNYKHSAAEWYVGLRTSSQLLGNTGFHFYNTTSGQTVGGWDINGHSYSIGSSRAPIFYDSNDTTYYTNPASRSNLGDLTLNSGAVWNATTQGLALGALHLDPNSATDHAGGAITFGASDSSNGTTSQAGIYVRSDGTYGTRMYLSTTDSYAVGSKTTIRLEAAGGLYVDRGSLYAPIYYDKDNTTYYLNPADTSTALSTAGKVYVQGSHGSARVHINYDHGNDAGNSGALTSWVSEPGITYHSAGIGGNINVSGQYYGRAYNAGYGSYVRFDKSNGNVEHWVTTGTAGTAGGQGTRQWYNDNSGNSFATTSSRAPIFFDSNDTGYYLNPATGSILKGVQINTNSSVVGSQLKIYSTTNHQYPQIHSNAALEAMWNYKHSAAEWYVGLRTSSQLLGNTGFHFYNTTSGQTVGGWDINGHSYSIGSSRAPLFYDSNDTNYYFDPNSTTLSGKLRSYLLFNDFGAGIVGSYSANRYQLVFAMGNSYKGALDGTNVTGGYGLWYSHPNAGGVSANLSSHGLMNIVNGAWHASLDASTRASSDMRAPIFYDLNDTAYYLNPATTSNLNDVEMVQLAVDSYIYHKGDTDTYLGFNTTDSIRFVAGNKERMVINSGGIQAWELKGVRTNLASSEGWAETNAWNAGTQTGYYGANFTINGSSDENNICYIEGPSPNSGSQSARRVLAWKCSHNGSGSGADGGWNKTIQGVDYNKAHISVVYVKRVADGNGNFYHGTTTCLNMDGSTNGNPYFVAMGSQSLPLNVWCVSIGYLHANNDTEITASHAFSGIYNLTTGERILGATDFRMAASTTSQHRAFLYYASSTATEVHMCNPGFYEVNGNEPNINELLMRSEDRVDSIRSDVDMRAPIFYDYSNTSYYVNPDTAGTSINVRGEIRNPSIWINDGDNFNNYNENIRLFNPTNNGPSVIAFSSTGTSGSPVTSILGYSDRLEFRFGDNHQLRVKNGYVETSNDHRAPIYYDLNNTTYYTNPASTSNINALTLVGNLSGQNGFFAQKMSIGHTGTAGGTIHLQRSSAGTSIKSNLGGTLTSSTIGLLQYTSASMFSNGYHLVFQAAPGSGSDTNMLLCDINGNLRNRNNSYGQYSDIKLKENISDATPKLEDINKLKVKNFNLKGDDLKQIGLIAQEVEQVFPSLVEDTISPDGEDIKSLKYSVLVPILIKGMQEQQVIINDLKTRLETLENQ